MKPPEPMHQHIQLSLAFVVVLGLAGMPGGSAAAQTAFTLTPAKDNTLFSENGSLSNGAGQYLFAGTTGQGNARRALLAFDVAGALPSGASIEAATLTLQMSKTTSGAETIALYRVTADWGEGTSNAGGEEGAGAVATAGDATWSHAFFNTTPWQNDGGDFTATASATASVSGNGSYSFSSAQLTADVQAWLDNPAANFGWIVVGDEVASRTAKRFNSRENSSSPPTLRITIAGTTPTEPVAQPAGLSLGRSHPDPFTSTTTIRFVLPHSGHAILRVYDVLGRVVATLVDGVLPAGEQAVTWQPGDASGGLYVYRLDAGGRSLTRTVTLLR